MALKLSENATTSYIPPFDPTKLTKVSENSSIELPVQTRTRVFSVDLDREFYVPIVRCHNCADVSISVILHGADISFPS